MTSIEQAIEAALNHAPELDSFLLTSAIIETVESKHLIPADDREALIAALGLEQVGWRCEGTQDLYDNPADFESCSDCPDCVPVFRIPAKP